jgi:hypothetical protein
MSKFMDTTLSRLPCNGIAEDEIFDGLHSLKRETTESPRRVVASISRSHRTPTCIRHVYFYYLAYLSH